MAREVVVDPLTRIEGHMRVEVEVEDGVVTDAWVSGNLYRGMETVLKDRRPQDAFYVSQRICGVCPISHGHASTMSAESVLRISRSPMARDSSATSSRRAQYLHSHILWFYTLAALDYVDPAKALEANIADTYALAEAAGTTSRRLRRRSEASGRTSWRAASSRSSPTAGSAIPSTHRTCPPSCT